LGATRITEIAREFCADTMVALMADWRQCPFSAPLTMGAARSAADRFAECGAIQTEWFATNRVSLKASETQ
jgi:hypothetical protein